MQLSATLINPNAPLLAPQATMCVLPRNEAALSMTFVCHQLWITRISVMSKCWDQDRGSFAEHSRLVQPSSPAWSGSQLA